MPQEKKLNCNPDVLKKLQKDGILVQTVKYIQKKGSTKPEDRQTTVDKVSIQDQHVTGCRMNKTEYSVVTIDGRHYRGKL